MNSGRRSNPIIILAIIFSLFLSISSDAKQKSAPSPEVDAIESTYYGLSDLSSNFVQSTNVALVDRTVNKNGTFKYKKGGKLRIEYLGDGAKTYVSDGSTLWIFVPDEKDSLQTFVMSDETVPKEALSFLSGFGKLSKEFVVSKSAAFKDAPLDATALHLIPRSKAKHYESLDALFGPDHILKELIIQNTSGNRSHYKFSDIKTNTDLPDKLFKY